MYIWTDENLYEAKAHKLFKKMVAGLSKRHIIACFVAGSEPIYYIVREIAAWNNIPSVPFTIFISVKPETRRELGWSISGMVFTLGTIKNKSKEKHDLRRI